MSEGDLNQTASPWNCKDFQFLTEIPRVVAYRCDRVHPKRAPWGCTDV